MVFVLDQQGKAVMPCSEKRARLLLERGRARVHRRVPFVIRLVDRQAATCQSQALRLKLDPGSKTTGLALVRATGDGAAVLNLFELLHRGRQISEALTARRQMRRRRRGANLRYRAPALSQPGQQTARLAGALAPAPRRHDLGLGVAPPALGADHRDQQRVGPLRHATARQPGNLGRGLPAGHFGGLRSAGILTRKMGPHVRLLRCPAHPAAN